MHQMRKFLSKIWKGLDTELSRSLASQLERGDELEVILGAMPRVEPINYVTARDYLRDVQATDIIRKIALPSANTAEARREKARTLFLSSEAACEQTNVLIRRLTSGMASCHNDVGLQDFLNRWRTIVCRVLGPIPCSLGVSFSGGSTLSDKGLATTIPDKLSSEPTCTQSALDVHRHTITGMNTELARWNPVVVRANRFFTVPKDWDKDRGCCVEPSENIRLQLAVGKVLRKRYQASYGIDLREAQPLHRQLALEGSWSDGESRELATIDLSSASDTISRELVRALLPEDWWLLLNSLRTHFTDVDGQIHFSAKFSSMGNGFTFELETIIFRTLLQALKCELAWCYGDDIIVEVKNFRTVCNALKVWGFTPNPRKTFGEGPFRESCGGDYFNGEAVRPAFLKTIPEEPHQWIALRNALYRVKSLRNQLQPAMRFCVDQLPVQCRQYGPQSLGDLVLHDDEAQPYYRADQYSGSFWWRVWKPIPQKYRVDKYYSELVVRDSALIGTGTHVSPRGEISGYRIGWVLAYGLSDEPTPDKPCPLVAMAENKILSMINGSVTW